MLSGHLVAGGMVLIDGTGLPIVETEPPAPMDGYTARYSKRPWRHHSDLGNGARDRHSDRGHGAPREDERHEPAR